MYMTQATAVLNLMFQCTIIMRVQLCTVPGALV